MKPLKTYQIMVRMPVELKNQIKEIAEDDDRSVSWYIRKAIEEYIERNREFA